jgi:hypothetical protein
MIVAKDERGPTQTHTRLGTDAPFAVSAECRLQVGKSQERPRV